MIPKLEIMCGLNVDKRAIDELVSIGKSVCLDEFGSFTFHEYKRVIDMMDKRDHFKTLSLNDSPKPPKPSNLFLGLMERLEL